MYQTVAIKFLDGNWKLFNIPNPPAPNGDKPLFLNLDKFFTDRDTSIRFKNGSKSGRLLYIETNLPRKAPRQSLKTINYFNQEEYHGR